MRKRTTIPLIAWAGLAVTVLIALSLGGSPVAEGQYIQLRINSDMFSASYLGDNTNLYEIRLADNDGNIYRFTDTGQTILNIPENGVIIALAAYMTIDDNYANSINEADVRTRVDLVITDGSAVEQFGENLTGPHVPTTSTDNGTFYDVYHPYTGLSILLTPGTWDLDAEYFILSIPI